MASISHHVDLSCDVVFVGNMYVGKTCIIHRHCRGTFSDKLSPTIGIVSERELVEVDGKTMEISYLDTAGQERFDAIIPMFYRKADAFVLVYDVTMRASFEKLTKWMNDIERYKNPNTTKTNAMIIGNKTDLVKEREVFYEEGCRFAEQNQMHFFETSAKTGDNIEEAFAHIRKELTKLVNSGESRDDKDKVNLSEKKEVTKRCCSQFPPSFASKQSSAANSDHSLDQIPSLLSIDNLDIARRGVRSISNWFDVGLELGLLYSTLTDIKNEQDSTTDCTREMLAAWLMQKDDVKARGGPTWKQLTNALQRNGHTGLRISETELFDP